VARRRTSRRGASHALMEYAAKGPTPLQTAFLPAADGETHRETVYRVMDEWKAWRDEHLVAWRNGEQTPPPPNTDLFVEND
jgi:hypothetical protein